MWRVSAFAAISLHAKRMKRHPSAPAHQSRRRPVVILAHGFGPWAGVYVSTESGIPRIPSPRAHETSPRCHAMGPRSRWQQAIPLRSWYSWPPCPSWDVSDRSVHRRQNDDTTIRRYDQIIDTGTHVVLVTVIWGCLGVIQFRMPPGGPGGIVTFPRKEFCPLVKTEYA